MATLYIVATPIGNLEDITLRALRVLTETHVVFAEDTRVISKLLSRHEIKVSLSRLDANTEVSGAHKVLGLLAEGKNVAYVSDAGTPGVSDPGSRLVRYVREENKARVERGEEVLKIEAVPGPSSLTAALSVAGIDASEFTYLGFLPHKKGRKTALERVVGYVQGGMLVALFESTHRIIKLLSELSVHLPQAHVTLARELTKIHEEVFDGTPEHLLNILTNTPVKQKGEFVVFVAYK